MRRIFKVEISLHCTNPIQDSLDFSKTFHMVWNSVLHEKLSCLGFKDQVINWIRHFLVGRTMKVIVKDAQSEAAKVRSGVPQGSVLGPILFLLFIKHVAANLSCVRSAQLIMFACFPGHNMPRLYIMWKQLRSDTQMRASKAIFGCPERPVKRYSYYSQDPSATRLTYLRGTKSS